MDLSLQSIKTNSWITVKKNMSALQWVVNLTPQYSHVTLVSGYPTWQLSIDYYMDARKDVSLSIRCFWGKA